MGDSNDWWEVTRTWRVRAIDLEAAVTQSKNWEHEKATFTNLTKTGQTDDSLPKVPLP